MTPTPPRDPALWLAYTLAAGLTVLDLALLGALLGQLLLHT